MIITIYRERRNYLYTEGQLAVNDKREMNTVEATEIMLPVGTYPVTLAKVGKGRKQIVITSNTKQSPPWTIGLGHSWIGSKKDHCISIGQILIPGALYKGTALYERLYDRIEKCLKRKETITLEISEHYCVENQPIKHWL